MGASARPAKSIVKNLDLPFFFLMDHRYFFACSESEYDQEIPQSQTAVVTFNPANMPIWVPYPANMPIWAPYGECNWVPHGSRMG